MRRRNISMFNINKPIIKYAISKKFFISIILVFSILMSCFFSYEFSSANKFTYEIPTYIRVGLTTYYGNKTCLYIKNKSITLGYDLDNFTEDVTFECSNAFRFENNTSDRLISKDTYSTYDEVLEEMDGDTDLLPVMVDKGVFKIATKPNRTCNHIDMKNYIQDDKSIVLINGNNKEIMIFEGTSFPFIMSNDNEKVPVMKFKERQYRGYIQIVREKNMTAINHIDMDEYLYSVLASEMSTSWPIEALKAQAITARTYALKKIYAERFKYYDVVDSTSDQVYKGYTLEGDTTIKATDETSGMVLIYVGDEEKYKNKLVDTYYYACNGGVTEEPQNVWSSSLPYLKSKIDIYEDENKYYGWQIRFDVDDLYNALKRAGTNIGDVTGCKVEYAKESGRVLKFIIIGTKTNYTVSKDSIRTFFTKYMSESLNSTNFKLYSGKEPVLEEQITQNKIAIINGEGEISYKNYDEITLLNGDGIVQQAKKILNLLSYISDGKTNKTTFNFEKTTYKNVNPTNLDDGEYLIVGNGWGHGVGMSQYGAKNMAEKDFDYEDILTFYYNDVDIIELESVNNNYIDEFSNKDIKNIDDEFEKDNQQDDVKEENSIENKDFTEIDTSVE